MKKYKYDAFISYRHSELDIFAAENLHRMLEAFRLPGKIAKKKKNGRTRIERVFRDKDELPLTSNLEDPIIHALEESEYLIVICSPRLRESLWCKREIETFISLHGRDKVLAVLIEGEPDQSFPEELLFREEKVAHEDGTVETIKVPAEPLAADIRGKDKAAMKKALKNEILRLLAPIFELSYDDLRQRHRERRMKKILTASAIACAICLSFGAVSTFMALRIQSQKTQIEAQNDEIQEQNIALVDKQEEIEAQNHALLQNQAENLAADSERQLADGDRIGAINTAVTALTSYEGIEMPYTAVAELALTQSLRIYDNGRTCKPAYQMETVGLLNFVKLSPERDILMTYDNTQCLTLWNIEEGKEITRIYDVVSSLRDDQSVFISNQVIIYLNNNGLLSVYDFIEDKLLTTVDCSYASDLCVSEDGSILAVIDDGIKIYNTSDYSVLYEYQAPEEYSLSYLLYMNREGTRLVFQEMKEKNLFVRCFNIENGTCSDPIAVGRYRIQKVKFTGNKAYYVTNYDDFDLKKMETIVSCLNMDTCKLEWTKSMPDRFGSDILLPSADSANHLLFVAGSEAYLLNVTNGEQYSSFALGSEYAGGAVHRNKDIFIVFTRNGEYHNIFAETKMDYYFADSFACHSQNVSDFLVASNNYMVVSYLDNHITVYDYFENEDREPYEGNINEEDEDSLTYSFAAEKAGEMKLPKAALADGIFYNDDKSVIYVTYSDYTVEIYNVSDNTLLGTISSFSLNPDTYLGTDQTGNIYIGGTGYGYKLNSNYELIAVIEGLCGIDKENNRLIVKDSDGYIVSQQNYTLEELLAKAEAYVLR